MLVTNGNRPLQASLKLLPGIAVTTIPPAQYNVKQNFDAVIFDRFAPIESPSQGAIFFRPPQRDWLPRFSREVTNPLVTGWDESQPSIASVSWRDLHVHRAALSKTNAAGPQTNWVWTKSAEEGALVVAQNVAPRRLAIGFAVDDSNLAMQSGFPVFLGRSLDWLTQQPGATLVRGLGHIEIPIGAANVIDHAGNSIATQNVANATLFNAPQPDVFTVTSTSGMATVIANVIDPKFSDVNRSRFADRSSAETLVPMMPRFQFELWVALLTIALALLAFEWLSFTSRMTI